MAYFSPPEPAVPGYPANCVPKHANFVLTVGESLVGAQHSDWRSHAVFWPQFLLLWFAMRRWPKLPWMTVVPIATILLGYFGDPSMYDWGLLTLKSGALD